MKDIFTKHKSKFIVGFVIVAVLAVAFFWGGNYPKSGYEAAAGTVSTESVSSPLTPSTSPETSQAPDTVTSPVTAEPTPSPDVAQTTEPTVQPNASATPTESTAKPSPSVTPDNAAASPSVSSTTNGMTIDPKTGKDKYQTDPVPEGKPIPVEPEDAVKTDKQLTCTLSVRCDTILNNMDLLDKDKWELVPEDGVIFATATVTFYEGESVLNILQREMKKAGIQMEFSNVPMYNSAYIEGINNLYEFDVGELSGWMYKVNGWFPNYGCSRYQLKAGDVVEWAYTCDLGKDVGGNYAVGGS